MIEPRACGSCGKRAILPNKIKYKATRTLNGEKLTFIVPHLFVDECQNCKDIYFTSSSEKIIIETMLRKSNYLHPDEIIQIITKSNLSIPDVAKLGDMETEYLENILIGFRFQTRKEDKFFRSMNLAYSETIEAKTK